MTATVLERTRRREMNAAIHHPNYRVMPAGYAGPGFFIGVCKVCPPGVDRYQSTKTTTHNAEKAVIAHLKDKHDITEVTP